MVKLNASESLKAQNLQKVDEDICWFIGSMGLHKCLFQENYIGKWHEKVTISSGQSNPAPCPASHTYEPPPPKGNQDPKKVVSAHAVSQVKSYHTMITNM